MTKTKEEGECPICGKTLQRVAEHIRIIHKVKNNKERSILNHMSTGRILLGGGKCHLVLCGKTVLHLEKHIRAHTDLTQRRADHHVNSLKRTLGIKQLADLRTTNPHPPMVSKLFCLHIQYSDSEEEDLEQVEQEEEATAPGPKRTDETPAIVEV